jgi:flagellar hook-basal body complex protein FliE
MGMREQYQSMMEKQLNEWKLQAEKLKAGAEQWEALAKSQLNQHLDLVRAKQSEAWEHLQNMKQANEGTWAEVKEHVDKAGAEVRAAMESIATRFKR